MSKKLACVLSLSQTVIQLSRRAISRARPELDAREVDLLFVAYHYSPDLADRVRPYLGPVDDSLLSLLGLFLSSARRKERDVVILHKQLTTRLKAKVAPALRLHRDIYETSTSPSQVAWKKRSGFQV